MRLYRYPMMRKDTTIFQISTSGLSLAHQAVGMGDVVFHSRLCNAVEAFARVADDRFSTLDGGTDNQMSRAQE